MKLILLISVLFWLSDYSVSQEVFVVEPIVIDNTNGIPSNEVYRVFMDRSNNIWFLTDKGVARFDGMQYQIFTKKTGLTDNVVFDVVEDEKDRLWFITYNSKLCYYTNGKFSEYKFNHKIKRLIGESDCRIIELKFYKDEVILNIDKKGIYKIDNGGSVSQLSQVDQYQLTKIGHDRMLSHILLGIIDDSVHLNIKDSYKEKKIFVRSSSSYGFGEDKSSSSTCCFVGTEIINLDNLSRINLGLKINKLQINGDLLVISTENGCLFLNKKNFKKTDWILKGENVSSVLFLDESKYIVSTIGSGAYFFDKNELRKVSKSFREKYSENVITLKENVLYLKNGIIYNTDNNKKLCDVSWINNLKINIIDNHIFLSGSNTINVEVVNEKFNIIILPWSNQVVKEDSSSVLIASNRIYKYDYVNNIMDTIYDGYKGLKTETLLNNFTCLISIKRNSYIFCTRSNVFLYSNNKIQNLLKDTEITSVSQFKEKILLISKEGILYEYIIASKRIIQLHDFNLDTDIHGMSVIKNRLFLISNNCLYRTKQFNSIDSYIIIPENKLNSNYSVYRMNAKNYLINGFSFFEFPEESNLVGISKNQIKVDSVVFNGVKYIASNSTFSTKEGLFNLYFDIQNSSEFDKRQVQFRMNDSDWQDVTDSRLSIMNPIGEYIIDLRLKGNSGLWTNPIRVGNYSFSIPFVKSTLFYVLVASIILSILFLSVIFSIKSRLVELNNRNKMLSYEQRINASLMNPHFIFNSLNVVLSFIILNKKKKAISSLKAFSDLLRKILKTNDSASVLINDEIRTLNEYVNIMQFSIEKKIYFDSYTQELGTKYIPVFLLQPIIENSIKYSNESEIFIKIIFEKFNEVSLKVNIESNNSFVKNINVKEGHSLSIIKRRLAILNEIHKKKHYKMEYKIFEDKVSFELIIPILKEDGSIDN